MGYKIDSMDAALVPASTASASPTGGERVELGLEGMTCAACATRIEKVLNRIPGVDANVNFATETATARIDARLADKEQLVAAVERAGYRAFVRRDPERERHDDQARKAAAYAALKTEFVIAAVLTLPLLVQMVPMFVRGEWFSGAVHQDLLPRWAATRARNPGPVLGRPALLHRLVARASRRRREHGRIDRVGHHDGVGVQRRDHAARTAWTARVLRSGCGGDYAGAAR
jgi:cation transport ATPase